MSDSDRSHVGAGQVSDAFRGNSVLVTGADGFIGSHLVERLVELGARVRAFVYYNSWNQVGWLSDVSPQILKEVEIFRGDIRDPERVNEAVIGQDYVLHLSSLVAIPYSYRAARSYVDVNVGGVANVLLACRASQRVKRLVHTSTSEVYGSARFVPITEEHPLVGQSPYSATKIAADKLAESFYLSFDLPVVTARPFNTFGPRQTARAVIPTIASQLLNGSENLKLGALTPTRDFNYVTDTVEALIALAGCDAAVGEVVNIGSGEEWSIADTARLMMQITERDIPIITEEARLRPEKSEVNRLLADTSKLHSLTTWRRGKEFEDGLRDTTEWISRNMSYFSSRNYAV